MVIGDIAIKARELVGADSTSYPNANLLINLNIWHQKIATIILSSQDESDFDDPNHGDYPRLTFSLVANQRDYPIGVSEKVLKIKRLDVTYDGSQYYKAEPIDSGEVGEGLGNDTTTDGRFSKTQPSYDFKYGSIWLYPRASTADVSAGAQAIVEWERQIKEFTSSDVTTGTLVPGFDDPWHPMLAYGAALEYAIANPDHPAKKDIADVLQDYEVRLREHYSRKLLDRKYQMKAAFTDYE